MPVPHDPSEIPHDPTLPASAEPDTGGAARWHRLRGFVHARLFGDAPPTVGRYRLLESIGSGGMGVVFSALDTELQRKVAIKLLTSGTDRAHQHRLQREARAMARVDHPNVVGVYDVGEHDGEVFVAMELVRGRTLRSWLAAEPRPWREIVTAFAAAARGLAAAHAAGLVHRDFKPENVLVSDSGRVCVVDFGLVTRGALGEPEGDIRDAHVNDVAVSVPMLGTPAYMSPEQVLGRPVDVRADVWSFCVALFEALHGVRPFDRDDAPSTLRAIVNGEIRTGSARSCPRRVDRIIRAGLRTDRDARTESMDDIADDLDRVLAARRRRWTILAAATGVTAFAAVSVQAIGGAPVLCDDPDGAIAAVWSHDPRVMVEDRFDALGLASAPVVERIDGWAARWAHEMGASCALDDGSVDALARLVCLETRRHDLAGAVSILGEADEVVARNAEQVLAGVVEPATCVDPTTRPRVAPVVDGDDADTRRWRLDLSRARALWNAGDDPNAKALAGATFDAALAAEAWTVAADAGVLFGEIAELANEDLRPVMPLLRDALAAAERSDHRAAEARLTALSIVDPVYSDPAELQQRYARAYALAEATDDAESLAVIALATGLGRGSVFGIRDAALARARYDMAKRAASERLGDGHRLTRELAEREHRLAASRLDVEGLRAELAATQARWGSASGKAGLAHAALASALAHADRIDEAIAEQRAAVEILERIHGELGEPHTTALAKLAQLLATKGDVDGATATADRAIAALERVPVNPLHFGAGPSPVREDIARALVLAGRSGQAVPYAEIAVRHGDHKAGVGAGLVLAEALVRTNEPEKALATAAAHRALLLAPTNRVTPVEPLVARYDIVRAEALLVLGKPDEAHELFTRALPLMLSNANRDRARAHVGLGRIALLRSDRATAASELELARDEAVGLGEIDPVVFDIRALDDAISAGP